MKKYYLGLDVGGTKIMYMLADGDGNVIKKEKAATTGCLNLLAEKIREFLSAAEVKENEVAAMALGVPGCVDKGHFISDAPALGWHNLDLTEFFSGFPFISAALNDVTCSLMAECESGYGRDSEDILFISIGTGLGSAFKAGGRVIDGHLGMSGEIGYFVSDDEAHNLLAGFGGSEYGALERVVSGTGLTDSGKPFGLTAATVFEAARSGSVDAVRIIDSFVDRLAVTTANCVSLLNPEYVVYGGGISNELPPFMERLSATVARLTPTPVKLRITELKTDAGALGAVAYAKSL